LVTWFCHVTSGYSYSPQSAYITPLSFLFLEINQPSLSNFTPQSSYAVIPRCGSPFFTPILLRVLYPHYSGDPGKITSWSSIIIYLPRSVGSLSSFNYIIDSYDDNNLFCLVQDSLFYLLSRLPSSVPSFS
jgi:hypothetical protein